MLSKLEQRDASLEATTAPGAPSLGERLVSPEPDQAERLAHLELLENLRKDVRGALGTLDARERFIAELRLLAEDDDQPSLAEIGRRLGVSRERARQLETRAKQKLRPRLERHARAVGLA
jgi:RNA polymerase sigma-32 factor